MKHVLALIALCLSAQITVDVPWGDTSIPFSWQSLVVMLIGWYSAPRWAALIVVAYWVLGAIGLPVFADGRGGVEVLTGGSGGFLHGFLWSALWLAVYRRRIRPFPGRVLFGFLSATLVLFTFGLIHLTLLYDFGRAVQYGLAPFWIVALIKVGLLWAVVKVQQGVSRTYSGASR